MSFPNEPIQNIEWRAVDSLSANGYNPNVVMNQELKLLEFSILKNGWMQAVLITKDGTIIDGFHRWTLARAGSVFKKYRGLVPCVVMDLDKPAAMLLTIRINRAKGSHVAYKMSEIIRELVDVHRLDQQQIALEIGAAKGEVDLLYQENVFKTKNIQNVEYSQAWAPRNVTKVAK